MCEWESCTFYSYSSNFTEGWTKKMKTRPTRPSKPEKLKKKTRIFGWNPIRSARFRFGFGSRKNITLGFGFKPEIRKKKNPKLDLKKKPQKLCFFYLFWSSISNTFTSSAGKSRVLIKGGHRFETSLDHFYWFWLIYVIINHISL